MKTNADSTAENTLGDIPTRTWLAGMAMQGILARRADDGGASDDVRKVACWSCQLADALLAELAKEQDQSEVNDD